MDVQLTGKVALILGAGGGLGRATAVALAREGAKVALADINEAALAETSALLEGADTAASVWDLSDLAVIPDRLSEIEDTLGPIDILVNITGGPPPSTASGQDSEVWSTYFGRMVLPVICITDHVLEGMRARGWGRVITSTSSGVVAPISNLGLSNTLRSSLTGWSKTLASEVGRDGITSNIVVPGRIGTARVAQLDEAKATREGREPTEVASASAGTIPVGRYGRPEEFADVVTFLASPLASYVTGSMIRIDGGLIASM